MLRSTEKLDGFAQSLVWQGVAFLKAKLPEVGSTVCCRCGSIMVPVSSRGLMRFVVAELEKEEIYVVLEKDKRTMRRVDPPKVEENK